MSVIGEIRKIVANSLINKGVFSTGTDKTVVIVMYHGIDKTENTQFNPRFFSISNFEKQIATFKKRFNILTHTDFISKNFAQDRPNILLTFDDGYANNATYAVPILDKYSAHAYFFVTGVGSLDRKMLWADAVDIVSVYGMPNSKVILNNIEFVLQSRKFLNQELNIDLKKYVKDSNIPGYTEKQQLIDQLIAIYDFTAKKELDDYWQLMTNEQIRAAATNNNITIGSHGFYHNNLGSLSTSDAVSEVMLSKNYLQDIIQGEVSTIAFPDGSYTEPLNDMLYTNGFTGQFLVDYRFNDENKRDFTFSRFGLYPGMGNKHEILYKILKT